ncbi:insulinase family protein [Nisaea acidiphila]|uniref:Insulinase family protein n=1 Tax=Nisaea acidiphila TaxID=1862145 RepID=A0A9J7AXU6_9PROT|nr:pitrilysin family protein [Nisaea acidiphila]UUX51894.1 insulinase family protein [Nisaea acidiphila]
MTTIFLRAVSIALGVFLILGRPGGAEAIEIQRVVSPGGIEAWLVEDHKNPIITFSVSFEGGAAVEPEGKEGLANMVAALLDEGAGPYDSEAFRRRLEDRVIGLGFNAGRDGFGARLRTLTEYSDEAFDLLRLAMTEPRFDTEPVERIRAQIVSGLKRSATRPQTIASRTWWQAAFPDHPYGRPSAGTVESIGRITVADMKAFADKVLTRDAMEVGVVGDIDPERLGVLLDRTFGALPDTPAPEAPDAATLSAVGETFVIEEPVPQSVVVFGHRGIPRDDPDRFAAAILMEIMAGGFGSRLTEEIREKRGLTYGIYAYSLPLNGAQMIMGGVSTRNDKVAETVRLVREIWAGMAEDGPTEAEVRDAKTYINGSFPMQLTSSAPIAGMLVSMQRNKRPIDYLDRRPERIDSVTMEDLKRVAKRLFLADELTFVVVGQPKDLKPTAPVPEPRS